MTEGLSLSLNNAKEIQLTEQAKNITTSIGEAFSNAVKKGTEKITFPEGMVEKVKDGFEKIDFKEIGGKAAESALKEGMKSLGIKSTTFSSIKSIFEAIKEGDLKKGLSSGLNLAITKLKVPKSVKNIIKEGKNIILEKTMNDELKTLMKKQQNTISRIDKKCIQMEEAFKSNDIKTLDNVAKTLKTDIQKVMPIQDVINRGNKIINQYELYKSKGGEQLSKEEIELCKKLT